MKKNIFFEAPEDGGGALPAPEPSPAAEPSPSPAPVEPSEAWVPSQQEWGQMQQFINAAAPILSHYAQSLEDYEEEPAAPSQLEGLTLDPFNEDSVQQYVNAHIEAGLQNRLEEALGPYQQMLGMVASQQGQQLAEQTFAQIQEEVGEFDRDLALVYASGVLQDPRVDPTQALRRAAQVSREWEQKIRSDERERYQQELQSLQQAPAEAPPGGVTPTPLESVPTGPRRYHEAVERALARRSPVSPTG